MKRSIHFLTATAAVVFATSFNAQEVNTVSGRGCGSAVPSAEWEQWFSARVAEQQSAQAMQKAQSTYVIPVVIHVIHGGESINTYPNLSKVQLYSQFVVLNADFAGSGFNSQLVPPVFAPLKANCDITFQPAELDPNGVGLVEPGIHRVNWKSICATCDPKSPTNTTAFQAFFDSNIKPATIWDPSRYLNIWVSDLKFGIDILGYATYPPGSGLSGLGLGVGNSQNDGIWVKANCFGNQGNLDGTYNKGRTATHELGHWLGLRHIWGDASCGDDLCSDTPTQQNFNTGCPNFPKISCGNAPAGEMFMNFMDYCDDKCLYMFTQAQKTRMITALNNSPLRQELTASSATLCNLPQNSPQAEFAVQQEVCMDSLVYLVNMSTGTPGPVFTWSANPSDGVSFSPSSGEFEPVMTVSKPGNYQITVTASNSSGTNTRTQDLSVIDCAAVGIRETMRSELVVAPNPNQGVLEVSVRTPAVIEMYNQLGEVVFSRSVSGGEHAVLDLYMLADGIYVMSMNNGGAVITRKIVVAR